MPVFQAPSLNALSVGRVKPDAIRTDAIGRRVFRADEEPRKDMGPQMHPSLQEAVRRLQGRDQEQSVRYNDTNAIRHLQAQQRPGDAIRRRLMAKQNQAGGL